MGDTSETNTKVLSQELFLGVVALRTPIQKTIYVRHGPSSQVRSHYASNNYGYTDLLCFNTFLLNPKTYDI